MENQYSQHLSLLEKRSGIWEIKTMLIKLGFVWRPGL